MRNVVSRHDSSAFVFVSVGHGWHLLLHVILNRMLYFCGRLVTLDKVNMYIGARSALGKYANKRICSGA